MFIEHFSYEERLRALRLTILEVMTGRRSKDAQFILPHIIVVT